MYSSVAVMNDDDAYTVRRSHTILRPAHHSKVVIFLMIGLHSLRVEYRSRTRPVAKGEGEGEDQWGHAPCPL